MNLLSNILDKIFFKFFKSLRFKESVLRFKEFYTEEKRYQLEHNYLIIV